MQDISTVSPDIDLEVWDHENNDTYNDTEYCIDEGPLEGLLIGTPWFQGLIFAAYTLVFVVALIGNGLVVIAVRASPRMRTVTNLLLMNLAGGDLLLAIACVPFSFVPTLILQHWPFGLAVCKLVSYCQTVSVLVSAYTLLAISVERYAAIMRPLRPRLALRHARWVVFGVWVGALATSAPILIVSQLSQPSERHKICEKYQCTESWEPEKGRYYSFALLGLQYALPLSVLVFTYSRIAAKVWGRRAPGEAHKSRDRWMARNKRKMVKMMVVVVLVFTICWAPLNLLLILLDFVPTLNEWPGLPYAWFAAHWLAMSHSCYNPLVYGWMNARFRAAFSLTLSKVPLLGRCIPKPLPGEPLARANTSTSYISVRGPRNSHLVCNQRPSTELMLVRPGCKTSRIHFDDDEDVL